MTTIAWVVGAGGLLGRALTRALRDRRVAHVFSPTRPLPWSDPASLDDALRDAVVEIAAAARAHDRWLLVWVAGAGVIGTSPAALHEETKVLARLTELLATAGPPLAQGAMFLASSAGGVYGSCADAPLTEQSTPAPISEYGRNKLVQEGLATAFCAGRGLPLLIGRISNIYGPGQNLSKAQGFISQLSRNMLLQRAMHVFVPLDTQRDFIFVDDCAEHVVRCLGRLLADRPTAPVVKIFASEQSSSLARVVGLFRQLAKRQPRVVCAPTPVGKQQAAAHRYRSVVWRDLPMPRRTELLVGLDTVHRANLRALMAGRLAAKKAPGH